MGGFGCLWISSLVFPYFRSADVLLDGGPHPIQCCLFPIVIFPVDWKGLAVFVAWKGTEELLWNMLLRSILRLLSGIKESGAGRFEEGGALLRGRVGMEFAEAIKFSDHPVQFVVSFRRDKIAESCESEVDAE